MEIQTRWLRSTKSFPELLLRLARQDSKVRDIL
jgi:hypothetical protein